jgi:hypothetical protein
LKAFKEFARSIVDFYEEEYLWQPTWENIVKKMSINRKNGWSGMFGSLDIFIGHGKIVIFLLLLDIIFIGMPCAKNNRNVIDYYAMLVNLLNGTMLQADF